LGLLNDGKAWGYTIAIIVVAFSGKFFGCAGAAWMLKFNRRESLAIGMLMSCKGLVELIGEWRWTCRIEGQEANYEGD
jgi:Kef-type K+ transport system membrane component KefB